MEDMFLVPICCIFKFKTRLVDVKGIQVTFVAFPEIQNGGQKETMRGKWSVHTSANLIFHFSNKNGKRKYYLSLL